MSPECTTDDCLNHTDAYLCTACVRDLQAWLDKVPVLIAALGVTIAKLDNVRPAGGGWNSGSKPGSAAPINLDALQLQENLRSVGRNAKDYAHDERAAGLAWLIQDWVTKAELLVSGPEEPPVNHAANRERIKGIAPPMPTRQLVPWLRQRQGNRDQQRHPELGPPRQAQSSQSTADTHLQPTRSTGRLVRNTPRR